MFHLNFSSFSPDDSAPSGRLKPLTSFDISCTGQYLCAGTEVFDGDSFLLFWDVRSTKMHGGYFDSHQDDITQVTMDLIMLKKVRK